MNIQSGYGVQGYQGTNRIASLQTTGNTARAWFADAATAAGAGSRDQVAISSMARDLAARDGSATQARTPIQEKLLRSAASDPQTAEKLASDMANMPSTIFYDIRDQLATGKMGPVNKLSSGRIIDDSFKDKFASEAAVIDAQRKAIYDSEKAKGTPADQILAKLFDFTNAQSKDYLEASGRLASVGGKAG